MKYYLAYGSNLNKEQMAYRCPDAVPVGTSVIEDYELVFRRGYLTIEPKEGSSVPVGVWRITAEDEQRLDRYEGYPRFYYKDTFPVRFEGMTIQTTIPCMVYIMQDGHPIQRPSEAYLETVSVGYLDFGFDRGPLLDAYRRSFDYQTDYQS